MITHSFPTAAPCEVELKLVIDPDQTDLLCMSPVLQQYALAAPRRKLVLSTYFDTPDWHLRQQQMALRLRQFGTDWVQTLKGGGSAADGLHQRLEWEAPVAGPALELAGLQALVAADSAPGRLLRDTVLTAQLQPVFTTRFQRTLWDLQLADGAQIECALDQGRIEAGDQLATISELELELKAGDPACLFALAERLRQTVVLVASNLSKAERGYALRLRGRG